MGQSTEEFVNDANGDDGLLVAVVVVAVAVAVAVAVVGCGVRRRRKEEKNEKIIGQALTGGWEVVRYKKPYGTILKP